MATVEHLRGGSDLLVVHVTAAQLAFAVLV